MAGTTQTQTPTDQRTVARRAYEENWDDRQRARVEAGAALLDDLLPRWWTIVDLDSLAMGHGSTCVCAQVRRTAHPRSVAADQYALFRRDHRLSGNEGAELGFDIHRAHATSDGDVDFHMYELTQIWTDYIRARRSEDPGQTEY